jgi:DNA (cytosine-5)-methyltransferase 1
MTRNGALYLQPEWVRPTDETELSLWPTPTAHPDNSNLKGKFKNPTLGDAVRMWPTPTTQETEHSDAEITETGRRKAKNGKTSHSLGLADAVQKWPTPQANDAKNPYARIREFSQATMLGEAVLNADPTAIGGKLNPTWVEWLMGFPTGWTDLED